MPIYEYQCNKEHVFEKYCHTWRDKKDIEECPTCGEDATQCFMSHSLLYWYDVSKKKMVEGRDYEYIKEPEWDSDPHSQAVKRDCEAYERKVLNQRPMGNKEAKEYSEHVRRDRGFYDRH